MHLNHGEILVKGGFLTTRFHELHKLEILFKHFWQFKDHPAKFLKSIIQSLEDLQIGRFSDRVLRHMSINRPASDFFSLPGFDFRVM